MPIDTLKLRKVLACAGLEPGPLIETAIRQINELHANAAPEQPPPIPIGRTPAGQGSTRGPEGGSVYHPARSGATMTHGEAITAIRASLQTSLGLVRARQTALPSIPEESHRAAR